MKNINKTQIAKIATIAVVTASTVISIKSTINSSVLKNEIETLSQQNTELALQVNETLQQLNAINEHKDAFNTEVTFNYNDVRVLSGATLDHMQRALEGTGLFDDAQSFIDAEEIHQVNAFFIAAIAAQESSWGSSDRASYQNNLTGYAVYNSKAEGKTFYTRHDSIMTTAKLIKEEYVSPNGKYFNGYTVASINKRYCLMEDGKTIDYNWSDKVKSISNDLIDKANNFSRI